MEDLDSFPGEEESPRTKARARTGFPWSEGSKHISCVKVLLWGKDWHSFPVKGQG